MRNVLLLLRHCVNFCEPFLLAQRELGITMENWVVIWIILMQSWTINSDEIFVTFLIIRFLMGNNTERGSRRVFYIREGLASAGTHDLRKVILSRPYKCRSVVLPASNKLKV